MFRPTPFFLSLLFFSFVTLSLKSDPLQSYSINMSANDSTYEAFCMPLRFTRNGIQYFLRNIFNNHLYATDYLPHNFSHFVQFIHEGKKNKQPRSYICATTRLFMNKLKSSRYVSAYAFSDMLHYMPELMKEYCTICHNEAFFESAVATIKDSLYSFFLNKFSFFKEDPDTFFEDMTQEITTKLDGHVQRHVECEELRQVLIRFLEVGLNKLVWSPDDQLDTWDAVKTMAKQLTDMQEAGIINQDELDDLFKSLLESYCSFLDLTGSQLSLNTINQIKEDIVSGNLLFLELEEQEAVLEKKSERIHSALLETEAKVRARLRGIITEPVVVA